MSRLTTSRKRWIRWVKHRSFDMGAVAAIVIIYLLLSGKMPDFGYVQWFACMCGFASMV